MKYSDIVGYLVPSHQEVYDRIAKRYKNKEASFLVIGAFLGRCLVYLANITDPKLHTIYAIDPFRLSLSIALTRPGIRGNLSLTSPQVFTDLDIFYKTYLQNLAKCKVLDRIITLRGSSNYLFTLFPDKSLDFVFVDGRHTFKGVTNDIKNYWPKIKNGGIIAGDDYHNKQAGVHSIVQVKDAVDECFGSKIIIDSKFPQAKIIKGKEGIPSWWQERTCLKE